MLRVSPIATILFRGGWVCTLHLGWPEQNLDYALDREFNLGLGNLRPRCFLRLRVMPNTSLCFNMRWQLLSNL